MPITKSAQKALRQSLKRKKRNIQKKKRVKELTKQFTNLISEKKIKEAEKLLPSLYKTIDKAVKTNLLKKNTGSRKKSRMAKMLKSTTQQ